MTLERAFDYGFGIGFCTCGFIVSLALPEIAKFFSKNSEKKPARKEADRG